MKDSENLIFIAFFQSGVSLNSVQIELGSYTFGYVHSPISSDLSSLTIGSNRI